MCHDWLVNTVVEWETLYLYLQALQRFPLKVPFTLARWDFPSVYERLSYKSSLAMTQSQSKRKQIFNCTHNLTVRTRACTGFPVRKCVKPRDFKLLIEQLNGSTVKNEFNCLFLSTSWMKTKIFLFQKQQALLQESRCDEKLLTEHADGISVYEWLLVLLLTSLFSVSVIFSIHRWTVNQCFRQPQRYSV